MSAGVVDGSLVEAGERRSCSRIEASGMTALIVSAVWGGESTKLGFGEGCVASPPVLLCSRGVVNGLDTVRSQSDC